MATADPLALSAITNEIYGKAAFAAANLGQLPLSDEDMSKTSKFLAQVGDYTYALSRKVLGGGEISEEDYKSIKTLSSYAEKMSDALIKMEEQIYSGSMHFSDITRTSHTVATKVKAMSESVKNLEAAFTEYPSLIYDGPFSEHIDVASPVFLFGKEEVSKEQAMDAAKKLAGKENGAEIEFAGENGGKIPTFNFSVTDKKDKNHSLYIEITKAGGYPLILIDNRFVGDKNISLDDAKHKAAEFIKMLGFENMRESYYEIKNNTAVINYSFNQDSVTVYPDLMKVKIALDNGAVTGFEARGYLMHHYTRTIPHNIKTREQARENISPMVEVISARMAIIPKGSQREVLCHEFKCTLDKKTFLIYINAETGREEDILMLIETPDGTLVI